MPISWPNGHTMDNFNFYHIQCRFKNSKVITSIRQTRICSLSQAQFRRWIKDKGFADGWCITCKKFRTILISTKKMSENVTRRPRFLSFRNVYNTV